MNICVHKFGGASLRDALFIDRAANIVQNIQRPAIVIVSAIGKTTNALEEVVQALYFQKNNPETILENIKKHHFEIIYQLFNKYFPLKVDEIQNKIKPYWQSIEQYFNQKNIYSYGQLYDQIVSIGELISSIIFSEYLNAKNIYNQWIDIRNILITDNQWQSANIDYSLSQQKVNTLLLQQIQNHTLILTQGFIASTHSGYTVTLGREGSDYTAALMAYFTNAQHVTIWKDVEGVFNADPRYFKNPQKIDKLNYYDAIEMTYYGATVIHPKTIKPIQNKNIPLYVKSFLKPEAQGTVIHSIQDSQKITTYSYLPAQILISLQSNDYSFFAETHLQTCFQIINQFGVKINLMQNTALNFSICVNYNTIIIPPFIQELKKHFKVLYNENVAILTIRHYLPTAINDIIQNRTILLEQRTRHHVQFVLKEK